MSGKELPKIVDKSPAEIEAAITAIESSNLQPDIKEFAISCVRLAVWLPDALLSHKITLSNLRKLVFGKGDKNQRRSKKPKNDKEQSQKEKPPVSDNDQTTDVNPPKAQSEQPATKRGHGRLAHSVYKNTVEHHMLIPDLKAEDPCPRQCGGNLYSPKPGIIVRVQGQNLAAVHKYWIEKLRCALCSYFISAEIPSLIGNEKYDATFKALLVLQKYYVAVPFNRQAYFQSLLGVPLPASTQWQLVEEVGGAALLVFPTLERIAANGELIHNDDSHVKITDIIRYNRLHQEQERTGTFTSGLISRTQERDIALFYNSKLHAGENLERLLQKRNAQAETVIQMCDALSRNVPQSFKTILCNCLSHGFRKFDDLKEFYPDPCIHVMERLSKVFEYDEKARDMTKSERLQYHQEHSKPIMDELYIYLGNLLSEKKVEPNDALGKAVKYMIKHWPELTQFLRIEGAPIDNNMLERALKIPIRGRRTWLFYKTEYGAMIGGVLTSIIYTCVLSDINPLHYLIALQEYKNQIVKEPEKWLPWTYQDSVAALSLAA